MKDFFGIFIVQLMIIGLAINVRTDISFWAQIGAYCLIASIYPFSKVMENYSVKR